MRRFLNLIFNRITITALLILLQLWFIVGEIINLYNSQAVIGIVLSVLSAVMVVVILYKDSNPAVKLAWIVPILLFPVFGGLFYLLLGHLFMTPKLKKNVEYINTMASDCMKQDDSVMKEIEKEDKDISTQCRYISRYAPAPVTRNTASEYYSDGSSYLESLLEDLEKAEKFIFMEYFIVGLGSMWSQVLEVLSRKVQEGVEVRLIYDDFGSSMVLPNKYYREMEKMGISCVAFNRIVPFFSIILNNRDHRKIVVIDGKTGYTGGINISDEYINKKERFGYWKDAGLRIEGDAVWNLTVMFLQMWNVSRFTDTDFEKYRYIPESESADGTCSLSGRVSGYVQPYGDSPIDDEQVGENVYLNIINNAKDYLWIYTPYLIVDNVMMEALKLACKRGVDVRIVTPGIPDKKSVFYMTRCSYKPLMSVGARIYEFTPGFIHSKCTLCDDEVVDIGTINYDYRSLYHHFECGVFLYKTDVTEELKKDMQATFEVSEEITDEFFKKNHIKLSTTVLGPLLHLFAPLL